MNALRFVIEGKGASTIVDGKDCPMEEGDLVITPGWTWHEHVHRGDAPIIWLDALDAPLHRYLGTDKFEPGPVHDLPNAPDDSAFAVPNIVPELSERGDAVLAGVPLSLGGRAQRGARGADLEGWRAARALHQPDHRRLDHAADGLLPRSRSTRAPRPCASAPPATRCAWSAKAAAPPRSARTRSPGRTKDVFSLPHGNWITHKADETATLFLVTDRDALRRLDLLKEQYGNEF